MPGSKRRYTPDLRAEAERLYRSVEGEKSMRQLAVELGISNETLRSWIKQADIDNGRREGPTTEEQEELAKLRRKVRVLEEEREILKAAAFFASVSEWTDKSVIFGFVDGEKANHAVAMLCRVLGVSTSGYYQWRTRRPSRRECTDAFLTHKIKRIHSLSRGTYGGRRASTSRLKEDHGIRCGESALLGS